MKNKVVLIFLIATSLSLLFYGIGADLNSFQFIGLLIFICVIPVLFFKPLWGLVILLFIRNIIDGFDAQTVLSIGFADLNLASILGIVLLPWSLINIFRYLKNETNVRPIYLLKVPLVLTWLAFIVIAIISVIYGGTINSFSVSELIKLFDYLFLFVLAYLLVHKHKVENILHYVPFAALIPSVIAVVQIFIGSGFSAAGTDNRVVGTFAHPNAYAFVLLISLSVIAVYFFSTKKPKNLWWIILGIIYFGLLVLTFTRSAWIGFVVIVLIWLIRYKRILIFPAVVILTIIFIFLPTINTILDQNFGVDLFETSVFQRVNTQDDAGSNSLEWRFRTWEETLPAAYEKPIFGHGIGLFHEVRLKYITYASDARSLEAHNDYLRLLIETGIVGVFLYILLYLQILRYIMQASPKTHEEHMLQIGYQALVIAILLVSFSDNVLRNAPVQWMFWVLSGLVVGTLNPNKLSFDNKISQRSIPGEAKI